MSNIVISGSIAYDLVMNFPGKFKDHILPDKINKLSVGLVVNKPTENFGGTAANIAYNLSLIKENPIILGIVGNDFGKYEKHFKKNKINTSYIKKNKTGKTANAYIITDQNNNQITSYYAGENDVKYCQIVKTIKNIKLAIVSPDSIDMMNEYIRLYQSLNIPYIFDPGQQTTCFTAQNLKKAISKSQILICNEYEIKLILNKLKIKISSLLKLLSVLIITKGGNGSEIYVENEKIKIPAHEVKKAVNPTGAGDAYRAGLIHGLINQWSWKKTGKLASFLAARVVKTNLTQVKL